MSASPSLIALTISIAMMVYLSFHHLALASRTGSGRIHLGIGLVGGASLVLAITRLVFYLAPTPEISILAMRATLASMAAVIWLLLWVCREFAGITTLQRELRAFGVTLAALALAALLTPWGARAPTYIATDLLGQTYIWVTMGPLVPCLALLGAIALAIGMWMLFHATQIDRVMRSLIAFAFIVYVAAGFNDALTSVTGHGVALFEHAYLVIAVVFDVMAVRRIRSLSGDLELEVARRTDELSAKNRDLATALQDASLASRAKSEFVANMSHEIRTPLNGVIGLLDVLGRTQLDSDQRDYVRTMHSASEALMAIVNQVLDFSSIRASTEPLSLAPTDPFLVAEEVVARLAVRAHERGIELGVICAVPEAPVPKVQANANALTQLLTNLVGNAIKFTQKGKVSVKLEADEQGLRIHVTDTGPGIAPELLATLFDPFVTSSATDPKRLSGAGTGLGLTIARELAERMNGTLAVRSEMGVGSTFTVTLGVTKTREPTASKIVHRATLRVVNSGAWLVGIEGLTHDALRAQLISLGAHVESIDVEEATRRISEGASPACILGADVLKMDDLARELVQRPPSKTRRVKVFAVARVGSPDEITGPRLGATPLRVPTTRAWLRESLAGSEVSEAIVRSVKSQLHVLVAEDNAVNRQVVALLLNEAGITFDIAENGALAVEAVKRAIRPYDAILMDCQMPVMDGLEATRAIRAHELSSQARRVPILAVTAHADVGQRDEILAAGMDAHLPKPLRLDTLLRAIAPYGKREPTPIHGLSRAAVTQALIAHERVVELASLGDREVTDELVQQLETDLLQADLEIAQSLQIDPPNRAQIRTLAHRIKGASLSLGAQYLSMQAATLEKSAPEAPREMLQAHAKAVSNAIGPSVSALRDAFASASP